MERLRAAQDARSPLAAGLELSLAAFNLPAGPELRASELPPEDDVVSALRELRSGQPDRVRAVLRQRRSEPVLASQVVALLGDDAVARDAADWLSAQEPAPIGVYADALLADGLASAARRRVARLLGKSDAELAVQSLLGALPKVPTSVRFGVAQALARLATRRPIARGPLLASIVEVASEPVGGDERLEQIFALLAATYPEEPIAHAFRALERGGDLRGTALEWLDVLLPNEVKRALWPKLLKQGELAHPVRRSSEELRLALSSKALETVDSDADL